MGGAGYGGKGQRSGMPSLIRVSSRVRALTQNVKEAVAPKPPRTREKENRKQLVPTDGAAETAAKCWLRVLYGEAHKAAHGALAK
jgi:hypothetical protein